MRRLLVLAALLVAPGEVLAIEPLVAALSKYNVAITTDFTGDNILAFGAINRPGDVVVVLRGPTRPVVMRRKDQFFGIWVNAAALTVEQVPAFYAVASSRPLEEIAAPEVLRSHVLGIEHLRERLELPRAKASENIRRAWKDAVVRNHQRLGLYPEEIGEVVFRSDRLFSTWISLPANLPTGHYLAHFYLLVDGQVVGAEIQPMAVNKVGVEAEIFRFAHEWPALYGIFAIIIALVAGWLADAAFRRP